jgi:hypothetical protein
MADIQDLQKLFDQIKQGLNLDELKEFNDLIKKVESSLAGFGGSPIEALEKLQNSVDAAAAKTKKLADETERAKKVSGDFDSALQKTIKTFTGITENSDTLLGSFINLAKEEKGLEGAFKQLGDAVKKTITPFNIATSSIAKLAEGSVTLALANDKAIASFNGATGAGGRFNKQILALEKSNRRFGIGAAEAGAALQNLIGGLSGFGLMADETQTALADEVAELSKLGVAASDTTGVFQSATKTFGMTTDAAMDLTQEAEALAQELGISLGQAVGDLNKALPQLAVLAGDEVEGAFKRLSEQAQETGLSIDELTSIADRFMTFEQAGKAASSLNAVLGTQMFDTMGLLEAQLEGPQAFIDTFREQLQGSVGDFDSLTVFQKQAIANAAGLSVVEVRNLMNAEALTDEQQEQARTREENLKTAMSLMDELRHVATQLTVSLAGPIKGITIMLDGIGRFLGFLGQIPGAFGAIAQIIAITTIPALIKMGVQFVAQKTGLSMVHSYIMRNVRAMDQYIARQRQAAQGGGGGFVPLGGGGAPYRPGMGPTGPTTPAPGGGPGIDPSAGAGAAFISKKDAFKGGLKAGGLLGAGSAIMEIAAGGDKTEAVGGGVGSAIGTGIGATLGAIGGPLGIAAGGFLGGMLGSMGGRFLGGLLPFAEGTPDGTVTPKGPIIVGEKGPEVLMQGGGNKVLSNEQLADGLTGGGGNQAVVAAINNLSTKMDSLMQRLGAPGDFVLTVNRREFARLTNEHFGAPGSSPVSGVT